MLLHRSPLSLAPNAVRIMKTTIHATSMLGQENMLDFAHMIEGNSQLAL
jgi:hypothetical protein